LKELPVNSLTEQQTAHGAEITRGQHGVGNYHFHSNFEGIFDDQPFPEVTVYPSEDIVRQIKGKLTERSKFSQDKMHQQENQTCNPHLSQESRA